MASNRIISQMAFLTALLASLLLSFGLTSSCSRKAADDESGTPIPSAEQPRQPGGGFDDPFENKGDNGVPPPGGFGDNTASFAFEMEEQEFAKYVDPNATLTYRFEYINVKRDGSITFADGKAQIRVSGLPVGQTGDLSLTILENGTEALKGTKPNHTLQEGTNQISLTLTPSGGGGEELADLTLEVVFESGSGGGDDNGGEPGNGGSDDNGGEGNGGDALAFTDVQSLAQEYCVPCHSAANTEGYWTARKRALAIRLNKGASGEMPRAGSPQSDGLSTADRQKLLDFVLQ